MQQLRWYAHYACQRSSKKIQWKITIWKLNSKFSRILRSRRISHREFQLISGFQFLVHSVLSTVTLEAFSLATVMQCCIYIFWLVNNLKKSNLSNYANFLFSLQLYINIKSSALSYQIFHSYLWKIGIFTSETVPSCVLWTFSLVKVEIFFPRDVHIFFYFPLRKIPSPINKVWNLVLKIVV